MSCYWITYTHESTSSLFVYRLISNKSFTINSAGISPATRQREQQARAALHRRNIAPHTVNFDVKCGSPEKEAAMCEDISFYGTHNPASSPRPCPISPCGGDDMQSFLSPGTSPSKFDIESNVQLPRTISQDSTSMDSGYCGLSNNRLSTTVSATAFKFPEPKRPSTSSPSMQKTPSKLALSSTMNSSSQSFRLLSSGSCDTTEDDFMELMDLESLDGETQMPGDLSSLICKDIKSTSKTPENKRLDSSARKCLNMNEKVKNTLFSSPSPKASSTITSLITTPERQCLQNLSGNINITPIRSLTTGAFKRPERPVSSPVQSKRIKCENDPPKYEEPCLSFSQPPATLDVPQRRPIFRKSMSMNDAVIKNALLRSSSDTNLIGDFTRPHCLPLIEGKHTDLKSISADTMRKLLNGEFDERVSSFKIIDCRYPYEYEGGHIAGALNLYTHEQILEELMKNPSGSSTDSNKRDILVFHCEFSSERGPKL